jgi:hypothetical protein
MKILSSIFNRNKDRLPDSVRDAVTAATVASETRKSDDDINFKQNAATNYELLHDDGIEALLEKMMYRPAIVKDKDNPNGLGIRIESKGEIDFLVAAIRLLYSHLNRASFLGGEQAIRLRIWLRYIMRRIKNQMRPDTYNAGIGIFLKAMEVELNIMISDAEEGRKPKLLKTIPRISTIQVETGGIPKKQSERVM